MGINYKTDTKKGYYTLLHPEKYLGNKLPIFKSGWEKKVFYAMDSNPFILKWGYECIEIYYFHPIYNAFTVYYPDIYCHAMNERGREERILIEIKPNKMRFIPKQPTPPANKTNSSWERYQRSLKRYQSSCKDYIVNMAKWEAAQNWCLKNGVSWRIFDETNTTDLFTSPNVRK